MTDPADDDGSIAIYFTVIAMAMLLAFALVVDGGRKIHQFQIAIHLSDNAARACAQAIDASSISGGARDVAPRLDRGAGERAVDDYMSLVGVSPADYGVTFADGDTRCVVTTRRAVPTIMLPIGPVAATQSAEAIGG